MVTDEPMALAAKCKEFSVASAKYSKATMTLFISCRARVSEIGSLSCNWRNHRIKAQLKNDAAMADLIDQAVAGEI